MVKCSVIVPIYNVESYLQRCIDSILAQTFTDFELILVDDGSTDGCGIICDANEKADSRIKAIYLNLDRLNELSKAINKHLNSCEGLSVMKKRFSLAHRNIINHAFDQIQNSIGQIDVFRKRELILANVLDIE